MYLKLHKFGWNDAERKKKLHNQLTVCEKNCVRVCSEYISCFEMRVTYYQVLK